MKKKIKKENKKGFTLLELVIAISLFAILILIVTQVFTKSIEIQKKTIDEQNLQGDIRNALAVFEDEVQKVTKHVDTSCDCTAGRFYCADISKTTLYVETSTGNCVSYTEANNRLQVDREGTTGYLTSDDITIEDLEFDVNTRGDSVNFKITFKGFADFDQYITYQTVLTTTFE
ncbi:MAG: type II secretion system protein [bacterium]